MKRITCEMCGGTDLIKQDGVFVCQYCGCKYSVEEARKLMVEVKGAVRITNAAQQGSLLKMAKSAFDSENYAKAEEFCNRVIAMDDKDSAAWKLKGEAVHMQTTAGRSRILEAYNCLMTAYRVLDEAEKARKKSEIIGSLRSCIEGEMDFQLRQFEVGRPTSAALARVKSTYRDSRKRIKAAYEELGLQKQKEAYLLYFDNHFIGQSNAICNSAWKTTVGYNYYREYFGADINPFERSKKHWVIEDTSLYRPTKAIWETFLAETDNMIELLTFAESRFNDETDLEVMEAIYSNIIYFEQCIIPSGSWKITTGFTSHFDEYETVGWQEEYRLSNKARAARQNTIELYENKKRALTGVARSRETAKKEKARKARITEYWLAHPREKELLEAERTDLRTRRKELQKQLSEADEQIRPERTALETARKEKLPGELEADAQEQAVRDLETRRDGLGLFKGKEKKAMTDRIETVEMPRLEELRKKAAEERATHEARINERLAQLEAPVKELRDAFEALQNRVAEINRELEKDR